MTPIRNVSDRERNLSAERDEYKYHAQQLMTKLLECTAERDALRELMNCYNLGGWTDSMALMQERDALKPDALRYRWLREQNARLDDGTFYVGLDKHFDYEDAVEWVGVDLDAVIDLSMKEGAT